MLISTSAGGGEIVSDTEETRFYDDIACLVADWGSRPAGARAYVRLSAGTWADAPAASYAEAQGVRTAMGSGLVAFATADEARHADRAGRAMSWQEIQQRTGERP